MNIGLTQLKQHLEDVNKLSVGSSKNNYDDTDSIVKHHLDKNIVRLPSYEILSEPYHTHIVQLYQYLGKAIDVTSSAKHDNVLANVLYDKIGSITKTMNDVTASGSTKATINISGNRLFNQDDLYMYDRLMSLYNAQLFVIESNPVFTGREIDNKSNTIKAYKELNRACSECLGILVMLWFYYFRKEDNFIDYVDNMLKQYL